VNYSGGGGYSTFEIEQECVDIGNCSIDHQKEITINIKNSVSK